MSQKKIKRFRKETKRILKEEYGSGMEILSKIVRSRPRWIPKSIWILAYTPLFERKYIKFISKYID